MEYVDTDFCVSAWIAGQHDGTRVYTYVCFNTQKRVSRCVCQLALTCVFTSERKLGGSYHDSMTHV